MRGKDGEGKQGEEERGGGKRGQEREGKRKKNLFFSLRMTVQTFFSPFPLFYFLLPLIPLLSLFIS